MQTVDSLRQFAIKAIETGKYVGGTAGAIKVVLKEIPTVMKSDEPQDLDYLKENIEGLLQRSGKTWETPTFNVYVTTFRRLVDDFVATGANVYKLRDPRPRMSHRQDLFSGNQGSGLAFGAPLQPANLRAEPANREKGTEMQRALTLPLPNGIVSLGLSGKISLNDWEHAKKMMDEQVRYILQASMEPAVETPEFDA